ncbi:MAG: hypothetical protein HY687_02160 [Chloroflexi bacterium]|nr:hypothetical protein [Chloroflexota bacterium]
MAYLAASKGQQAGLAPALRSWLVSLAGGVALGLGILAFLVTFGIFGYHNFTDFRPIESLEFASIDSPGSTAQFFVSPCSDGDSQFLFTLWVKDKAAGAP